MKIVFPSVHVQLVLFVVRVFFVIVEFVNPNTRDVRPFGRPHFLEGHSNTRWDWLCLHLNAARKRHHTVVVHPGFGLMYELHHFVVVLFYNFVRHTKNSPSYTGLIDVI